MNILDLPDEMLLSIINKLHMIDVLYSLVDVNQRFDRLVLNPVYINHLDLTMELLVNKNSPVDKQVLERICKKILPRINNKINKLTVDYHSMEDALDAVDYPQLDSLSFVNFQPNILLSSLRGKFC